MNRITKRIYDDDDTDKITDDTYTDTHTERSLYDNSSDEDKDFSFSDRSFDDDKPKKDTFGEKFSMFESYQKENNPKKRVGKITVKRSPVKKPTVKRSSVKKPTVKRSPVKKPTVKRSPVKKPTVKRDKKENDIFEEKPRRKTRKENVMFEEKPQNKTVSSKTASSKTASSKTASSKTASSKTASSKLDDSNLLYNKYINLGQLGDKGKDGRTFLVKKSRSSKEYAMKTFRKNKSTKQFENEVNLQKKASSKGLSPKIVDFSVEDKYIVMEKMERDLLDIIQKQNGKLKLTQEKQLIEIYKELDKIGVFHGDSNSLNIMEKLCSDGKRKLYIIDFGFSNMIDDKFIKKHKTETPNMTFMPLALLIQLKKLYPKSSFPYIEKHISKEVMDKLKI